MRKCMDMCSMKMRKYYLYDKNRRHIRNERKSESHHKLRHRYLLLKSINRNCKGKILQLRNNWVRARTQKWYFAGVVSFVCNYFLICCHKVKVAIQKSKSDHSGANIDLINLKKEKHANEVKFNEKYLSHANAQNLCVCVCVRVCCSTVIGNVNIFCLWHSSSFY